MRNMHFNENLCFHYSEIGQRNLYFVGLLRHFIKEFTELAVEASQLNSFLVI